MITVIDNADSLNISVLIDSAVESVAVTVSAEPIDIAVSVSTEIPTIGVSLESTADEISVEVSPEVSIPITVGVNPSAGVGVVVNTGGEQGPPGPAGPAGGSAFEAISKNIQSWDASYNYTGDTLDEIVYTNGSSVITKTLVYSDGLLTSVSLSGDTPSGIELTKSLTYTDGALSGVSYS